MENLNLGDIIKGQNTNHPIIFISKKNEDQFYGAIITHSPDYENNILMKEDHFKELDKNNNLYTIRFERTYLVSLKLEKNNEWGPYEKKGELSQVGIKFILKYLEKENPILWSEYINS